MTRYTSVNNCRLERNQRCNKKLPSEHFRAIEDAKEDSDETQKFSMITFGPLVTLTYTLTVSHQKSRIFFPPVPGSKAFGTPVRWLYKPVSSFWERRGEVEKTTGFKYWLQISIITNHIISVYATRVKMHDAGCMPHSFFAIWQQCLWCCDEKKKLMIQRVPMVNTGPPRSLQVIYCIMCLFPFYILHYSLDISTWGVYVQ